LAALYYKDAQFRQEVLPGFGGTGATLERGSEFVRACYAIDALELRRSWGHFYKKISMVKPCVAHSDKASEFEGRCFPSGINNALSAFQWSGDFEEMDKLFNVSKRVMDSKGQPALRWSNIMMRPMITFTEVRQFPVWERGDDPSIAEVMDLLERNVAVFKSELQALKRGGHFSAAYDHLVGRGTWSKVSLFTDGLWSEDFCAVARESCRLLRNGLPGRSREVPYAVMNHEEVVFFYSSPGSRVLPHNGAQNGRINVHIGLEGFEASRIVVHTGINQTRSLSWSDSEAVAFNDGWIHEVVNGESDERYVLALGIMHPDISEASYAECFTGRTMAETFTPERAERIRRAGAAARGAEL